MTLRIDYIILEFLNIYYNIHIYYKLINTYNLKNITRI